MEVDDFSFPATTEPCRFCIDSPPLWRVSAASLPPPPSPPLSPSVSRSDDAEPNSGNSGHSIRQGSLNEEKMDMLWEDFNEDLLYTRNRDPNSLSADCSKEMVQMGCVKALAIPKANGGNKSPGVVAMLKVLRKLFLIHSSNQRSLKKDHPW